MRHGVEHVFLELRLHGTTCDHFFDRGARAQHTAVVPRARAIRAAVDIQRGEELLTNYGASYREKYIN